MGVCSEGRKLVSVSDCWSSNHHGSAALLATQWGPIVSDSGFIMQELTRVCVRAHFCGCECPGGWGRGGEGEAGCTPKS